MEKKKEKKQFFKLDDIYEDYLQELYAQKSKLPEGMESADENKDKIRYSSPPEAQHQKHL